MEMHERVKVLPPKVDFSLADAPASFPAADLRSLVVPGAHEPRQWVFVRAGHGKGHVIEPTPGHAGRYRQAPCCLRGMAWQLPETHSPPQNKHIPP